MTSLERLGQMRGPRAHRGVSVTRVCGVPVPVVAGLVMSAALLAVYAVNSVVHFGGGVDACVNKWVYDMFPICCAALCFATANTAEHIDHLWTVLGEVTQRFKLQRTRAD